MINGAERSIEGSGDAGLLFVHLMQPGAHYLQLLCVQAKEPARWSPLRGEFLLGGEEAGRTVRFICLTSEKDS